jgi:arylsulfatase A-like enzyme/tetratricopeptide (TPR) repeat protein
MKTACCLSLAVLTATLVSCGDGVERGSRERAENLLLVTFDTTRADHIGCYGYEDASTPTLDALAASGVLFERCITPAPITLPSHSTLLTGFQPYTHGARNNGTHKVGGAVRSLAERFKSIDFATGAVISAFVLDSRFGLDAGFDSYDDDLSGGTGSGDFGFAETKADDTTKRALRWLRERGEERWFLWVHYFDPHADYSPPEPYASRCAGAPYDGEIAYTDAMLGTILDELRGRGELDETLVVVTADHGEALGDHGEETHGMFIYDSTTHVPLLMSHPSLPESRRVEDVIGLVDIAPTVMDIMGVNYGDGFDGRSFLSVMLSEDANFEALPAYSESMFPWHGFGWSDLRALRGEDWRYVRAPRPELYDLEEDPGEARDLSDDEPALLQMRAAELSAMLPEREVETFTRDGGGMDAEVESALSALGYTGADLSGDPGGELADPKDKLGDAKRLHDAEAAIAYGRDAEAEAIYRELVEDNPRSVDARNPLADLLTRMEKFSEALAVQREIIQLPTAKSVNFIAMAQLEKRLGVGDIAESLSMAKACDPRDPMPWVAEGELLHWPSDPVAAMACYQRAIEIDERCAKAWIGVCEVESSRRKVPEAQAAARRAVECDPSLHVAWFRLGSMLAAGRKNREAIVALVKASEIDPAHIPTWIGLSMLCAGEGERPTALQHLRKAVELDRAQVEQMARQNPVISGLLGELR